MRTDSKTRAIFSCALVATLPVLYLASFPPPILMSKRWPATSPILETLYAPAGWFYDDSRLDMDWYLNRWKNWDLNNKKSSRK